MLEFVSSAVVLRASVHDMVYPACQRCSASLQARLQARDGSALHSATTSAVECVSCGTQVQSAAVQYKYRLKIQVAYAERIVDAMLFDEAALSLVGVSATQLRKLEAKHPTLTWLLEELLVGLRVAFSYKRGQDRIAPSSSAAAKADAPKPKFTRDLRIVAIAPLASVLLPKPLVPLAMDAITQLAAGDAQHDVDDSSAM